VPGTLAVEITGTTTRWPLQLTWREA